MTSMTSAATHLNSNKLERETVLSDALADAHAISDDGRRAIALAALAPHQPETLLPKLDREFVQEGGKERTPDEVLLHTALVCDSTRFTRQDGVEETWRIMQALLDAPLPVHSHAPGSWEPLDQLMAGHGRWHGPWVTAHDRC
jgi:glucose-6-phosphate 1-dehydrogenase